MAHLLVPSVINNYLNVIAAQISKLQYLYSSSDINTDQLSASMMLGFNRDTTLQGETCQVLQISRGLGTWQTSKCVFKIPTNQDKQKG